MKLELWHDGDRSVGIHDDTATLEFNMPIMEQSEIDQYCYELALLMSESIFEGFTTYWDLIDKDTIISYGNTRSYKTQEAERKRIVKEHKENLEFERRSKDIDQTTNGQSYLPLGE